MCFNAVRLGYVPKVLSQHPPTESCLSDSFLSHSDDPDMTSYLGWPRQLFSEFPDLILSYFRSKQFFKYVYMEILDIFIRYSNCLQYNDISTHTHTHTHTHIITKVRWHWCTTRYVHVLVNVGWKFLSYQQILWYLIRGTVLILEISGCEMCSFYSISLFIVFWNSTDTRLFINKLCTVWSR